MKLSKEQRDLLFFLTQDEWITGQQISSYFQWDKKKCEYPSNDPMH